MNKILKYTGISILFIAILVFVGLTWWIQTTNTQSEQSNILYPFSGYLSPSNGSSSWTVNPSKNNKGIGPSPENGLFLVGMVGGNDADTPQISCPAGYRINIVGAYIDIADPNGTCSTTPSGMLKLSCGDSSDLKMATTCKAGDASSCAVGMDCPAGKCVPKSCTKNGDCSSAGVVSACPDDLGKSCPSAGNRKNTLLCVNTAKGLIWELDPGAGGSCMACSDMDTKGNGTCAVFPTCQNVEKGSNVACSPANNQTKCRPRDASAYLARHCDGKNTCLDTMNDIWSPNTIGGIFGPLPCNIEAVSDPNNSSFSNYMSLPINVGWAGGSPPQAQSNIDAPATFTQGYYVHGIYTCVPENQKVIPE